MPDLFLQGDYVPIDTEVTVAGAAVAFARTLGDEAVLFVAPRLCRRLTGGDVPAPLGGECWKTSRALLPPALRDRTFRHAITGADVHPTRGADAAWIFLGEIFETVPVGILRTVTVASPPSARAPC
jgi:(1->4)-alpha-D-glucan 1-alpha-D-glucosylmutase